MDTATRQKTNEPDFSTAYFFLEGLNEIGIEYLFCNFGTDHAPIIEEIAHRRSRGEPIPGIIRCPHENTAAHMAAGYTVVTGRGQGVLVHVDVGTANSATAMHNLFRSRIPVLLMAGKAPFTAGGELKGSRDTYVHFVQEPLDQGSLVRPYVKWEWTLPSGVVVKEALQRAHAIMHSEPAGPVYLMMQRETLTQTWGADEVHRFSAEQYGSTAGAGADPALIDQLADRLIKAENPILITGYSGRDSRAAEMIAQVAEFAGIAVFEGNATINVGHDSPCYLGFQPGKYVPKADVGLLVDVDVPWFPSDVKANPDTFWAHIDVDVLKPASPMWTFPGNTRMPGDSAQILAQLLSALKAKATPEFKKKAAARVEQFRAEHDANAERAKKFAADKGNPGAIGLHYLFSELNKVLGPDDLVFNEAIVSAPALMLQIDRPKPGTIMRIGGGGLGSSGGMALGAKLAAPDRLMVQVVGDGSFYFNSPCSVFAVAQQYKLPILSIVVDNSGWSAVKNSTLRVYPDGEAKAADEYEAELMPTADFGKVGEAFGAYGAKITDPADVPAAIARCVKEVRDGRSAVLHVQVTKM
ncbi:MAG: thiamine pyrophosphate-requiring protein [Xanthobacteraceae bacterium]